MTQKPTACLALADGTIFYGVGFGATGESVAELCFNTSMTGYQEIMTDPSYAGQMVTFTFPHIGNTGTNDEDIESLSPAALGCILREDITEPSNFRNSEHFDAWLKKHGLVGICGVDTRALTRRLRDKGAANAILCHSASGEFDLPALHQKAVDWPGLDGMDLAKDVTCTQNYSWNEAPWTLQDGYTEHNHNAPHVVAIDYGAKRNILRCLVGAGCKVTIVPASASYEDIMALKPDGVFLSNGPGDPAATGAYAVPVIKKILDTNLPVFGICLGHQMLAIALGAKTEKMHHGHRGANHPVHDLISGRVAITSQNHGFAVANDSLPDGVECTHISLFDKTNQGLRMTGRPVFSVQFHPEASPGPQDRPPLVEEFGQNIRKTK